MRAEVKKYDFTQFFPNEWFDRVQKDIDTWDRTKLFQSSVPFIVYCNDLREGRSLILDLRKVYDILAQSPKKRAVKHRFECLFKEDQSLGAIFELFAIYPLITSPNELIEFDPKIGSSNNRSEVLARVAGCDLYVEASVFTKRDDKFESTEVFNFDPLEVEIKEGETIIEKIVSKAEQYVEADKPVILFIAEEMATTGLSLNDLRESVVEQVGAAVPNLSAFVFSSGCRCSDMEMKGNPRSVYSLPQTTWAELNRVIRQGWRNS